MVDSNCTGEAEDKRRVLLACISTFHEYLCAFALGAAGLGCRPYSTGDEFYVAEITTSPGLISPPASTRA